MANQPETDTYDTGVYQWQTTDPVEGGAGGVANSPLLNLANRTGWLYNQLNRLATEIAVLAPIDSPNFTGTPTVPNVAAGDSSNKAINSAFVQAAINGLSSVNCAGAASISLTAAEYGNSIIVLTGAVTAPINLIFPTQSGVWCVVNRTSGSAITCKTSGGTGIVVAQGHAAGLIGDGTNIVASNSDFSRVNNLVSLVQALFSNGAFTDPDAGVTRDAKFGQNGIAIKGGTKTDTLAVTGVGSVNNLQAATGVFGVRLSFLSTTTWTCPAGVTQVKAWVTGGGGAGQYSNNSTPGGAYSSGGGGGAGGTAIGVVSVTPGTTYTVTVGAAGAPNGGNGGDSIFGPLTGAGGAGAVWGDAGGDGGGGGPGGATGGVDNHGGGYGGDGMATTGSGTIYGPGGTGGASFWGGGGRGGLSGGVGGVAHGSGGGGSYGALGYGGAGAAGIVVLEY